MKKLLLQRGNILSDDGPKAADILIGVTGAIERIDNIHHHKDAEIIDCADRLITPLFIDCHVHFREPGLTHKGTMQSEAASALMGGVGTVCEMPNTIPPTVTIAALADKVRRAAEIDGVVLKFFFGITEEAHLLTLRELWTSDTLELRRLKQHCCGVKLYLDHSTGDQKVDGGIVDEIFRTCGELHIPLVAHCEDSAMNASAKAEHAGEDISLHSKQRPAASEAASVRDAIMRAQRYGTHFHIAHLSTEAGLEHVRAAKRLGASVTCEVTPHHLFLTDQDYSTLGTLAKMNPPVRSASDQVALWAGIADGTVDCIATDHAPHTLEEKNSGPPLSAPSGVPGVATMLPLLLSVAAGKWPHPRSVAPPTRLSLTDIHRLCRSNPGRIFGIDTPPIAVGAQANLTIIDPLRTQTLRGNMLRSACGWTPFEGWSVTGSIRSIVRGRSIAEMTP